MRIRSYAGFNVDDFSITMLRMTNAKPQVGCIRLTDEQWRKMRVLWKENGGIKWMGAFIAREWRKREKIVAKRSAE